MSPRVVGAKPGTVREMVADIEKNVQQQNGQVNEKAKPSPAGPLGYLSRSKTDGGKGGGRPVNISSGSNRSQSTPVPDQKKSSADIQHKPSQSATQSQASIHHKTSQSATQSSADIHHEHLQSVNQPPSAVIKPESDKSPKKLSTEEMRRSLEEQANADMELINFASAAARMQKFVETLAQMSNKTWDTIKNFFN